MKEREETLKAVRKRNRGTVTWIVVILVLLYVAIATSNYSDKREDVSPIDAIIENFFDVITWNH